MPPIKTFSLVFSILLLSCFTIYVTTLVPEDKNVKKAISEHHPKPTQLQHKMEDESELINKRKAYWDYIHGDHPGVDWKEINEENFVALYDKRIQMQNTKAVVSYANGELAGDWEERGSNDQAGNVRIATFDEINETIYAVGDGGILFKGNLDGSNWQPLNDYYPLDRDIIEVVHLPDGTTRILATKGNGVYFSDDEGLTWTEANGIAGNTSNGKGIDLFELNDADSTIVYLFQYVSWNSTTNKIAYSKDHGETFTELLALSSSGEKYASMAMLHESSVAYILDGKDDLYRFEYDSLTWINTALNLNGSNYCQLEMSSNATDTAMYVLMDKENLYRSDDVGSSFNDLGQLPVPSWNVGLGVSIHNPDAVYYGEMELYRSWDGGNSFNKVSDWWEYYDDVANKIHADIMDIRSFKKQDGTEFTLIPNHGGINVSYDELATTPNIGMLNLNVGQFYDVATSPVNSAFIFGGTQDQGLLRTSSGSNPGTVGFEQVISGDYGQQQFSNNGLGFWTQYPGGDFSYYTNGMTDPWSTFSYDVEGSDMPNADWIIPSGSAPNPTDDYILVGGGEISGGSGSYLIKIANLVGTPDVSQFPFDFKAASGTPISAIETTPLNPDKWYVSTQNGRFYYSTDAGQSWTESTSNLGPGNDWIYSADIYASRLTEGLVFLGGSNYLTSPVYMSEDGGQNFVPLDNGNMPPTMVHEMCMDPQENFLFAATDAGPYVYSMNQGEWFEIGGTQAPIQEYISCEYVELEDVVRFATWGRGIWDFKMSDVSSSEEIEPIYSTNVYPNPSNGQFVVEVESGYNTQLIDLQGRKIMKISLLPGKNHLNLNHLSKGQYILVGLDNNGRILKEKIVIH